MQIAKQKKSTVLASNAVHHRIDSLTSIVALLAIAGSNILPTAAWLDPVGGLLVAVMVVQAGIGNTKTALYELADAGIDEEVKQEVAKKLATSAAGQALISIDGIKSGQNYLLTITAAVDGDKTLGELEMVEDMVRSSLADVPGMWRVQVRFVKKGVEPKNEFVKLYKKQQ
jgi:divalent metal cation (Fe/Co/Zn/Cd) transporter